jgi:Tfp pilus assembly protein PilZ
MSPNESEKRQYPRINNHFMVSYHLLENNTVIDLSQTKNLSEGGMAFNANVKFNPGAQLVLNLRIPLAPEPVKIIGQVVESSEAGKNIYYTRVKFVNIDEKYRAAVLSTIARQLPAIGSKKDDKRQYARVKASFIVSYRLEGKDESFEASQIKDLSEGGMSLNTNIKFDSGAQLVLNLRIPLAPEPVKIIGQVVESREVGRNIYYIRIKFISIDEKYRAAVINTIAHQLKKQ